MPFFICCTEIGENSIICTTQTKDYLANLQIWTRTGKATSKYYQPKKNLNRDCQQVEILLLSLKSVANFLKQLQEENVYMCQLKSRLLVGLHVTVVYVYSQQTRRQRFSVTFDSETKHGYSHALAICTSSQAIC